MNARLLAARIINDVTNGISLTDSFTNRLAQVHDQRDLALIQAMCYGVCRYYSHLDVILSYLLTKPMKAKDSDAHALLLIGLYQLIFMRIPPHAALSETVNAAYKLKKPWAQGLVNAILREYLRQKPSLEKKTKEEPEVLYAHPDWWIRAIKKAWPHDWQAILAANNEHPPLTLRVNGNLVSRDDYIKAHPNMTLIPETQQGVILEIPVSVEKIPGFFAGEVSVQDGAAQLAAELLELVPRLRVLDACAAPGGKLTHILELASQIDCVAVENEKTRMLSIEENLTRLKLKANCICADVSNVNAWWDGKLFDRILLDAPCSASGVIRRHPDIKLLRLPTDIKKLAIIQSQLLAALWPLLKPGGLLLYATCSIFPEENVNVLQQFLQTHPDAKEKPIEANWGVSCSVGRQILPGMQRMDGFYYARLKKIPLRDPTNKD